MSALLSRVVAAQRVDDGHSAHRIPLGYLAQILRAAGAGLRRLRGRALRRFPA
jgi:hypothetical protein